MKSSKKFCLLFGVAVVCLGLAASAPGETLTWTGATDNDWHTATNWNPNQAPTYVDDMVVNSGTPTAAVNAIVGSSGDGSLTIDGGDVDWAGRFNTFGNTNGTGLLTLISGSFSQSYAGTSSHGFKVGASADGIGIVDQQGGSLSATKTLQLAAASAGGKGSQGTYGISGGSMVLGGGLLVGTGDSADFEYTGASATVSVTGNWDADTSIYTSTFNLDGSARTIVPVSGNVLLDGSTLEVEEAAGASIALGTTYTLFSAGGDLSAVGLNLVYDPLAWSVAVTEGAGGSITATAIPEPSTLVLTVFGLIGLLCYAWRKRK